MANTKITNHIVDKTLITGQTAVTAADGDYLLVADASDSSALKKVLASDLIQTSEEVADIVGAMVSSNTESGITVAYQDSDNTIDFTIGTLNQNTTGSAATLTTARTIGGTSFDGSANIAVGLAATATALATSRTIHGVGFDGTANIDLSEVIQDTVGAMVSSNTETNITVTYEDSDGTIDFVVDAAQPNITSLGTLTTLTVDDITINGSTISDGADLTIDVGGDIILDAAGSDIKLKKAGTQFGQLYNSSDDFSIASSIQDKDIKFVGNDGGSVITMLRIDASDAGTAIFNHDAVFADNGRILLGNTSDFQILHDGSASYISSNTSDLDIIFQGNDGGSTITALTLDMSNGGQAIFNKGITVNDHVYFGDNDRAVFGGANDLEIYHNATNSYIDNDTGDLYLRTVNNFRVTDPSDNKMILCQDGGETQLYHNGTEKLNTDANGIEVQGKVVCSTSARIGQVAITSSSNAVAWDSAAAANAYHTTTENTTFSAPSNSAEGAIISVEIAQGGTARTIGWNTVFEFAASTAPTITATANKTDIFSFRYNGSVWQEIGRVQNMAQT